MSLLSEKLLFREMETWDVTNLHTYPLETNEASLKQFLDICHSVFIKVLIGGLDQGSDSILFKVNNELYKATFATLIKSVGNIVPRQNASEFDKRVATSRTNVIFNFNFPVEAVESNGKSIIINAEQLLSGQVQIVNADGSSRNDIVSKLVRIQKLCSLALRNSATYNELATTVAEKENRARERELKAAQEQEVDAAFESGDENRIRAALAASYEQQMNVERAAAARADATSEKALSDIRRSSSEALEKLDIRDTLSFILGWLAANITYMHVQVPYKKLSNGRIDNRAEYYFLRNYPGTKKAAKVGDPGYSTVEHRYYGTSGKLHQRYTAYYVHFNRASVQNAPEFVQKWLDSFVSEFYGKASAQRGTINSKALALYLYRLGFAFGEKDSAAIDSCKMSAANMDDFNKGYEWNNFLRKFKKPTSVDKPNHELDLDFPEVSTINASDYDSDYADIA